MPTQRVRPRRPSRSPRPLRPTALRLAERHVRHSPTPRENRRGADGSRDTQTLDTLITKGTGDKRLTGLPMTHLTPFRPERDGIELLRDT